MIEEKGTDSIAGSTTPRMKAGMAGRQVQTMLLGVWVVVK